MKNTLQLNSTFARVEFWATATIFAFVTFFFIVNSFDHEEAVYSPAFQKAGLQFVYFRHYFLPQFIRNITIFLSFIALNFYLVPRMISKFRIGRQLSGILSVFLVMGVIFAATDRLIRAHLYEGANAVSNSMEVMIENSVEHVFTIFVVMLIYSVIKYASLYVIARSASIQSKYEFVRREGIIAFVVWIIGLLLLIIADPEPLLIVGWIVVVPTAIGLYLAGFYYLIPASLKGKYPFLMFAFRNFVILFIFLMGVGFIAKMMPGDNAHFAALWIFNSVLQMCITVPIIWVLYKREQKGNEEMRVLKTELGQSHASIDFLRSQINPHFLFNALNTIYGTALQEGAERTGEAVQKLGDMMRFMLQENTQEKIPLAREVDYLKNYISLQTLRTASHPDIRIETDIATAPPGIQVAPMLFIPFVENAFKHGISFREPSFINIRMEVMEGKIHFQVSNSKHGKMGNDPEADKSGIGLNNVRQRLQLLYPGKHELRIRDEEVFEVDLRLIVGS